MRARHLAAYEGMNGKRMEWNGCRFVRGVSSKFSIHHLFRFVAENLRTSDVRLYGKRLTRTCDKRVSGLGVLLFATSCNLQILESPRARRPRHFGVRVHARTVGEKRRTCAGMGLMGGLGWFSE